MLLKDSGLDVFGGAFGGTELGLYEFSIEAWIDNKRQLAARHA